MRLKTKTLSRRRFATKTTKQNNELTASEEVEPKPLFMILQREYFNEILAGTKKEEFRDDTEFYRSRFLNKTRDKFKKYNTVIFQEGYSKTARRMTVEVTDICRQGIFIIGLGAILDKNFDEIIDFKPTKIKVNKNNSKQVQKNNIIYSDVAEDTAGQKIRFNYVAE